MALLGFAKRGPDSTRENVKLKDNNDDKLYMITYTSYPWLYVASSAKNSQTLYIAGFLWLTDAQLAKIQNELDCSSLTNFDHDTLTLEKANPLYNGPLLRRNPP